MAAEVNDDGNYDAGAGEGVSAGGRTRVFVYGTLKAGHPNHYLLEDAVHLGDCALGNNYCMVSMGWFPGAVRGANVAGEIHGEVYEIAEGALHALDLLEGHPDFFRRHKVQTPFKNAWVYLVPTAYAEGEYERIANGTWTGGSKRV